MMMRALVLVSLTACLVVGCSKKIDDHGASDVDFSNPKRVVSSIFFAAQEGQSAHLASLCDPKGEANVHARRICAQVVDGSDWPEFVEQFAKGKLIGEARVSGDWAQVNFVFGPSGTTSETMELTRRDGKWYLLAF
tara:strand:+ start:103129 stop:103536 length:408 start_codon:yes stop_codon:yes gene_type:complete